MTPEQYCQDKTASSGSSFYYSFLFLPEEKRRAITALYAFCREVDDVVDECQDAAVARAKLAWWRDEVTRLFSGLPQHPVTRALAPAIERFNLPEEHLQEVIDGMEMDLEQSRYPTFADLSLYCYRVAGVVGLMAAEIFGYEDRKTTKYALDLGLAFQLTNILRDVGEDAARGRIYIPLDELARFCVTEEQVLRREESEAMRALFAFQLARARSYYDTAFSKLPESDRFPQRTGLIMAAIYLQTLDTIEREGYPVLTRRVSLGPLRKLWIAWRTARGEARRRDRMAG